MADGTPDFTTPDFTIGIEEEYLLVERDDGRLAEAPDALMEACRAELGDKVAPEFLRCQIEVGTGVCATIAEARADLTRLRRTVARLAAGHGLAPIAASCHPVSDWKDQSVTDKDRYRGLERDLRAVARRMLICGMHVHVGIPDPDERVGVLNGLSYFLPHLLALSASSPFWMGEDTGLSSWRLTVFDNMPRTGLPPRLAGWADYAALTDRLERAGAIDDPSKIWWDARPSHAFPTLETRICDACPRIEDALTMAALVQAICRMLWRLGRSNRQWRDHHPVLLEQNRWQAQRDGTDRGLIDLARDAVRPLPELVDELLELVAEDLDALGSRTEAARALDIARHGNSAARQRAAHAPATPEPFAPVLRQLIDEFHEGL